MALLPEKLRYRLFDTLSLQTMRYVDAIPLHQADGKLKEIYDQINRDFFINGSLTSRSKVLDNIAASWVLGRETILVDDQLDRTTKEAIAATLSSINDCPYCGDMLVSLVHAGDRSADAMNIFDEQEDNIQDPVLRNRLKWVKAVVLADENIPKVPFVKEQLPEVIGSIMAMSDVNRFSHIVMDGSPVKAPYNLRKLRKLALKLFGNELRPNHSEPLKKGDSLKFLADAELPEDMGWANQNPRIAAAVARWVAAVEADSSPLVPQNVKQWVHDNLSKWDGSPVPMGRYWVDEETRGLDGSDRELARFALLLAKASYQITLDMSEALLSRAGSEENFIRILAWCSYSSARHLANRIARSIPDTSHLVEAA